MINKIFIERIYINPKLGSLPREVLDLVESKGLECPILSSAVMVSG